MSDFLTEKTINILALCLSGISLAIGWILKSIQEKYSAGVSSGREKESFRALKKRVDILRVRVGEIEERVTELQASTKACQLHNSKMLERMEAAFEKHVEQGAENRRAENEALADEITSRIKALIQ